MATYEEMIQQAHDTLFAALPEEMTDQEKALIEDAFQLAKEAHAPQTRDSGLPYILHPLAVALVVVKEMLQKGAAIVAAALLHDVVEDTSHTIEEIRARFGDDVAFLVGAVTKPNKNQVDNFQHILGSVNGDVRVLLLKLSDRLHNMRTLAGLRPQKQWKIASETQFFFAPLAGRLGLYRVKSELENLAFQFLNPQEYARIEELLEEDRKRTESAVNYFKDECCRTVGAKMGGCIGWDIRYRKPYSVWREMNERRTDFYQIPYKHYVRVHFDRTEVDDELNYSSTWWLTDEDIIFRVYSILTEKFPEQTGSLVNFLNQSKSNGYKGVHFRLLNPWGGIEEIHVASDDMRMQANYGCILDSKEQWLKRLTDLFKELASDPASLMQGIRYTFKDDDIVVFTPESDPVTLPKGSTALDFAYALHTDIGDHARYARINGRLSSIRAELKRGDCVEIVTGESVHPKEDWLDAVQSFKAKKAIRSYFNRLPKPTRTLCPYCNPMPGSEIIGFEDADKHVTIHSRNCPVAIRTASEKGSTIVTVDNFVADPTVLYPVKVEIVGIDRFHLLQEILDCIVARHNLSMTGLTSHTKDDIVTCFIEFDVHSADEFKETLSAIRAIDGVEEVTIK